MTQLRPSVLLSILWGTLFIIYILITPPLLAVGIAAFISSLFLIRLWGFGGILAVGATAFLLCLGIIDRFYVPPSYSIAQTKTLLETVRIASDIFRDQYGGPPEGEIAGVFEQLLGENPKKIVFLEVSEKSLGEHGEILDAWGTPIRMERRADTIVFLSAGQDRQWRSKDDIASQ